MGHARPGLRLGVVGSGEAWRICHGRPARPGGRARATAAAEHAPFAPEVVDPSRDGARRARHGAGRRH
eukprot:7408472-Lingulodinium_polyedra.AAC.1